MYKLRKGMEIIPNEHLFSPPLSFPFTLWGGLFSKGRPQGLSRFFYSFDNTAIIFYFNGI